jgi:hypothetical protein
MNIHTRPGRPFKSKSWDLLLRHTFRAHFLEDSDIHALMFVCGDQFSAILKNSLRDYVEKYNLPTNSPEFQSKLLFAATKHINSNHTMPDAIDVLESINELALVDRINDLAVLPKKTTSCPRKQTTAHKQSQIQRPQDIALTPATIDATTVASTTDSKPRSPLLEMDFGQELDDGIAGYAAEVEVKKTPLKDRWLERHKY